MKPEQWAQIEILYHQALEKEASTRARFLDEACAGNQALRQEVESLLSAHESADSFMEKSALQTAARQLARQSRAELIGQQLGPFEILSFLGAGGMGAVYLARDTLLERKVALKILPEFEQAKPQARNELLDEARAAAALDHPFICHIHEVGRTADRSFIAMEYVDGDTLQERLRKAPIPLSQALQFAGEICEALQVAHRAGIVHRDVKPANIMMTTQGHAKVMDFGLALRVGDLHSHEREGRDCRQSSLRGTPAYMAPEQKREEAADSRSDTFSFGIVLSELLFGVPPRDAAAKKGDYPGSLPDLAGYPQISLSLRRTVERMLSEDPDERPSLDLVLEEIHSARLQVGGVATSSWRAWWQNPWLLGPATALLLSLTLWGIWNWNRSRQIDWARGQALPEIERLVEAEDFFAAFRLAQRIDPYLSGDRLLERLREDFSSLMTVQTAPPGARVQIKSYTAPDSDWFMLGTTPLNDVQVPSRLNRWRVTREGFLPWEGMVASYVSPLQLNLIPQGEAPSGMVLVPGGEHTFFSAPTVTLDYFWIDQYEVSNRNFQVFVDAGGYQNPKFWKHRFVQDGQIVAWSEAVKEFRDRTGHPGPASWENGRYPVGEADFPVRGISWFEAAAYAEFVGKTLPTLHQWYRAAGGPGTDFQFYSAVIQLSNFGSSGPAAAGSFQGLGPWGTHDMGGNVKEWVSTAADENRHYILGGAWDEPGYMFSTPDAQNSFNRSGTHGFRCALAGSPSQGAPSEGDEPLEIQATPLSTFFREYVEDEPVEDEIFEAYRGFYAYDPGELDARLDSVETDTQSWRHEIVSYNAAYGSERVTAHLFLPRNARPPFQVVIYFPGAEGLLRDSSKTLLTPWFAFLARSLVQSGRAVVHPIYQGMFERRGSYGLRGIASFRDLHVQWSKDLGRTIDYLETRSDLDPKRIAFLGLSLGAARGPILTAIEDRFQASILLAGGLRRSPPEYPDVDVLNFAPRVRVPTLMINGRNDFVFPLENSQLPLFRLLGPPQKDKRLALFEAGHLPLRKDYLREILDWLDSYLGRVD